MAQLGKQRYRLQFAPLIDQDEWTEDATSKQLKFPAGTDLQIQMGVREKASPLTFYDLTNVDSMTLEVKDLAASDTAPAADAATLMAATVNSLDAATISGDDWMAGTAQHVTFNFTAVASNLTIGKKWLVVSAVLSDASQVSLGWGKIEVVEDGTGPNTPVNPLDPSYYTSAQTDTLMATKASTAQGALADTALQPDDVVDDLTSTDATKVLSASQGKVIKNLIPWLGFDPSYQYGIGDDSGNYVLTINNNGEFWARMVDALIQTKNLEGKARLMLQSSSILGKPQFMVLDVGTADRTGGSGASEPPHFYAWKPLSDVNCKTAIFRNRGSRSADIRLRSNDPVGLWFMGEHDFSAGYPVPASGTTRDIMRGMYFWDISDNTRKVILCTTTATSTPIDGTNAATLIKWQEYGATDMSGFFRGTIDCSTLAAISNENGYYSPESDAVLAGQSGAFRQGDILELTGADSGQLRAGDWLQRGDSSTQWVHHRAASADSVASGQKLMLSPDSNLSEFEIRDSSPSTATEPSYGELEIKVSTQLTAYVEFESGYTKIRIHNETTGAIDLLAEINGSFNVANPRLVDSGERLFYTSDTGGSFARRVFNTVTRIDKPYKASRDILVIGDSVGNHTFSRLQAKTNIFDAARGDLNRTITNYGLGSHSPKLMADLMQFLKADDTSDLADRTLVFVVDYAPNDDAERSRILDYFWIVLNGQRAAQRQFIIGGYFFGRNVEWNGSSLDISSATQMSPAVRLWEQNLIDLFGDNYLSFYDVITGDAALSGLYDPQFPTAADQLEIVGQYNALPFKNLKPVSGDATEINDPENLRGRFQGYWNSTSLPASGVTQYDYYVVRATSIVINGETMSVGDILWWDSSVWQQLRFDTTHPNNQQGSFGSADVVSEAVADRLETLSYY